MKTVFWIFLSIEWTGFTFVGYYNDDLIKYEE